MSSLNRVLLIGRLGSDPELRYTPNQNAVCNFSLATNEFRNVEGEKQTTTEWHRIVVWGKQAESCSKYLAKGRLVFVEGRLQTRSWEDGQGNKRYSTEIIAQNVRFLGGQGQEEAGLGGRHRPLEASSDHGADYETTAVHDNNSRFEGPETPSLDDIPF